MQRPWDRREQEKAEGWRAENGKEKVLSEAGGWALEVLGRTSVFSKSEKESLACFKYRSDILRFSQLDDCSNCRIENALGEGGNGRGEAIAVDKGHACMATGELFSRGTFKVKWTH